MNIVFLIPDMGAGGAERVISILSDHFANDGYDTYIVSMFGCRRAYELNNAIHLVNLSAFNSSIKSRCLALRAFLKSLPKDRTVVFAFQESCLNSVLTAKIGLNVKVVATERNNPYRKGSSFSQRLRASLPFIFSDYSVFQTPDARNYYLYLNTKKTTVIPNPISKTEYIWRGNIYPSRIVSVCRLHHQKNLPLSFNVVKCLKNNFPDIHLDIYGEGELKSELQKLIEVMGLQDNIGFCGTTKEVHKILSEYSLYLSTSDFEGISNSMLEAMSVGMPIVCTDCPIGGARLMLSNGAGYLAPVGDLEAIVDCVRSLLEDPSQAVSMGAKARSRSEDYSPAEIYKKWKAVVSQFD